MRGIKNLKNGWFSKDSPEKCVGRLHYSPEKCVILQHYSPEKCVKRKEYSPEKCDFILELWKE